MDGAFQATAAFQDLYIFFRINENAVASCISTAFTLLLYFTAAQLMVAFSLPSSYLSLSVELSSLLLTLVFVVRAGGS